MGLHVLHNFFRYAIAVTERPTLVHKVGWLDILANDTQEYYVTEDTTGNYSGPNIKVCVLHLC